MNRTKLVEFVNSHLFLIDWQWMDEHGTWHSYDTTVSHKIENLYLAGSGGTVDFIVFGRHYEADVTAMQQINKDTNVKRKIRRQVKATAASLPVASTSATSSTSSNSVRGSSHASKSTSKGLYIVCVCARVSTCVCVCTRVHMCVCVIHISKLFQKCKSQIPALLKYWYC